MDKTRYFGAYLAGVIDGDGSIRIKRAKYPQCAIRITSEFPQKNLMSIIKQKLKCGVSIRKVFHTGYIKGENRVIKGIGYDLEFLLSSKTKNFVEEFVLPWVQLQHKKEKMQHYLKLNKLLN